MESRKGFTLVELMVVILIVSILAAVAIPIMRGRIDSAKWTEGRSMAGTLATAIRAYSAEKGTVGNYGSSNPTLSQLGFATNDLNGTYFKTSAFSWTTAFDAAGDPDLTFTITVTAPSGISPSEVTLNQAGTWTES